MAFDNLDGVIVEEDGTMTVGFEIDTYVESFGGVVKMFDTSRGTIDWQFHDFLDILGRGTIGICGLNHTNLQFVTNASDSRLVSNEISGQGCYTVTIEQMEFLVVIYEVIDNSVRVPIKRAASF